ncbi:MAG: RNase adapter RapZ, partial [Pseudomonadota bacterium]|nr:RNase adapter RapZ [Pseudomonadota bacterium]
MKLIVISGRSGSGKSTALHALEDEGFSCIDNFPAGLLEPLIQSSSEAEIVQDLAV